MLTSLSSNWLLETPTSLAAEKAKPATLAGVSSLPNNIRLTSLERLHLIGCTRLTCLPGRIGQLPVFRRLVVAHRDQLTSLPAYLGQLKNLREFVPTDCLALVNVPDSLAQLSSVPEAYVKCECGFDWGAGSSGAYIWIQRLQECASVTASVVQSCCTLRCFFIFNGWCWLVTTVLHFISSQKLCMATSPLFPSEQAMRLLTLLI